MNLRKKSSYGRLASWEEMDSAMAESVRRALIVHKALGEPIWVLRDGEVVKIPAEEI